MIEYRADEFLLVPTWEQQRNLRGFTGCRRWVWNQALGIQLERLEKRLSLLSYNDLALLLTEWRNSPETEWLSKAPVHTQQAALRDLHQAIKMWRKGKAKFPRFKKKGGCESIRYPDCKQIHFDFTPNDAEGRAILPSIFLPKLGWVKFRKSRDLSGDVCNATVICRAGQWYVSIQVEMNLSPAPIPQTEENTISADMGIINFLWNTNNEVTRKPNHFKSIEKELAIAQRRLSRKKPGSKNYIEQREKVQRIHRTGVHRRNDFLHKTSTQMSKNHAYVKLEDANVKNMVKTRPSDPQEKKPRDPGSRSFNQRLLDVGWSRFLFYLDYKLRARGGRLILVSPAYTSQECSECGWIDPDSRPTQALFHCTSCHHEEPADSNASKVISKRAGPARFACVLPSNG